MEYKLISIWRHGPFTFAVAGVDRVGTDGHRDCGIRQSSWFVDSTVGRLWSLVAQVDQHGNAEIDPAASGLPVGPAGWPGFRTGYLVRR